MDDDIFISTTDSIKEAFKKLSRTGKKVLLVIEKNKKFLGTLTDGDIRRGMLNDKKLEDAIADIYNMKPQFIREDQYSEALVKKLLFKSRLNVLPIVDVDNFLLDYVTWQDVFTQDELPKEDKALIDTPVVIMAGGCGSRLEPFTKILPKPLIPIGDKTIIETIIDEFKQYGVNNFFIIINHKSELIKSYFHSMKHKSNINFIVEEDFYGTAGGLKLLEDKLNDSFIVSNCDIIVRADTVDVLKLHKDNDSYMTILSSIQHYKIPYGVIHYKERGEVTGISEKPEYTVNINTGVYVLKREALDFIPAKTKFDMTDLMNKLVKNGKKVTIYPVNENAYVDIGHWEEYKKTLEKFQFLGQIS